MKRPQIYGEVFQEAEVHDIQLTAGTNRMEMHIRTHGARLPVQTIRRALAYRKFLSYLDMPVQVYLDNKRLALIHGEKYKVYRPVVLSLWLIKCFFYK